MYKGEGVVASYRGDVTLPAPALVDPVTWQRAQEALLRNRRLSNNTKHTYLLRGLMRCGNCGKTYTGTTNTYPRAGQMVSVRKYRCGGQAANHHGAGVARCEAKTLHADDIETAVWEECRRFIHNPGEALDEARRKLRERKADSTRFEATRRDTLTTLAEKEMERERILTMYRKGKIDEAEAETQLDAIAKEAGQLREDLESMRAQAALLDISEAHLTESAVLLGRLRDEMEAIEATDDQARKREIIAAYVRQITVETTRVRPRQLAADITLRLRLQPEPVRIDNVTRSPGGRRWKRSASSWPSGASTAASA
jgi:site-specific DNA recombinase